MRAALVVGALLALGSASCTSSVDPAAPASSVSASTGIASSVTPSVGPTTPTAAATTAVSPEEQAAVEAEAAYRRYETETQRYRVAALRGRTADGTILITPDLEAILQEVAVSDVYTRDLQGPSRILQSFPSAAELLGVPVITEVVVDTVELYDAPRSVTDVDQTRDGVTAQVTLRSCVDYGPTQIVDAGGQRLDPFASNSRLFLQTVVVSRQAQPDTGEPGWFVANITNVEGPACEL